jgi:hypothetical protein
METTEQRLNRLEGEVSELRALIGASAEWVSVSRASELLGIGSHTLRRRIRDAIAFPRQSPYKRGCHWRYDGGMYQVNWRKWKEVLG